MKPPDYRARRQWQLDARARGDVPECGREACHEPAAYGKRCHECGRPAHGVEHRGPPVCKLHNTDIPF